MCRNWFNAFIAGIAGAAVAAITPWWIGLPIALAAGMASGRVEVLLVRRAERQMSSEATP